MTKTPETDSIDLGDLVTGLFKMAGIDLTEDAPDEKVDEDQEPSVPVDPHKEAFRILKDLEDEAIDKGDVDLALQVADRYITLGSFLR